MDNKILIQLNARREQALEDNLAALLYRLEEHVVIAIEALEKIAGQGRSCFNI